MLSLLKKYWHHLLTLVIGTSVVLGSFAPAGGTTYYLNSSIGTSDTTIHLASFKEPVSNLPYTMSYIGASKVYFTIDPQTSRREFGYFTGITQNSDGTADVTGVVRGLSSTPGTGGCVASTTLAQSHPGRAIFILSNAPCFYSEYATLNNAATVAAIWTYGSTTPPRYDNTGAQSAGSYIATTSELASVAYVNAVAVAGVNNASESVKGVVELATAAEQASSTQTGSTGASLGTQSRYATDTPQAKCNTSGSSVGSGCSVVALLTGKISQLWLDIFSTSNVWSARNEFDATTTATSSKAVFGFGDMWQVLASTTITGATTPQPVYVSTTTNALLLSAASGSNMDAQFVGFAITSAINGGTTTVQSSGVVQGFSGLTKGSKYYVQNSAGTIGATVGTNEVLVGEAISATELLIDRNPEWEYVGSGTCSIAGGNCDIPGPTIARFAIVNVVMSGASTCSGPTNMSSMTETTMVAKMGNTTSNFSSSPSCASTRSPTGSVSFSAQFTSTSSVRLSKSTTDGTLSADTQTAYFYR